MSQPYGVPTLPIAPNNSPEFPVEQPKVLFRYGEQSIWSSYFYPAGTVLAGRSDKLFATAISRNGQGWTGAITIAETNIINGGRVPNGVSYDVYGVAAQLYKTDAGTDTGDVNTAINTATLVQDLINVQYNATLAWAFTQTKVDIAPFDLCGAGGGAYGAVSTTINETSVGHMNNGAATLWMYRRHPVALPGATTFAITLRFGNRAEDIGTAGVGVKVVLLGFFKNLIEVG